MSQFLKLNFNENSLGVSPKVAAALAQADAALYRYPEPQQLALEQKLAERFSLQPQQVMLGAGSSHCIQLIFEVLSHRAKAAGQVLQLLMPTPTFDAGPLAAKKLGLFTHKLPLNDALEADLPALRSCAEQFDGQSIVYLCNPNNPTGTVVDSAELLDWVKSAPQTFFLIDEAYSEFVTDPRYVSADNWLRQGINNIVVTRTFSKLYGLAGLRIGYSLSSPEYAQMFRGWRSDLPVAALSIAAATAAIEDEEFCRHSLEQMAESKALVLELLQELGLRYAQPQGNFVFYELPAHFASNQQYREKMLERGVVVGRDFAGYERWNRISLGSPEEMRQATAIMRELLSAP